MRQPSIGREFETSVFVNCPFDKAYKSLMRPLLFTVHALGLRPRFALERSDSGELRFEKIKELILSCRWGIHDLSRCRSKRAGELYRMNMPLELGVDLGCRFLGPTAMSRKRHLILARRRHEYQRAISDLSGVDIMAHSENPIEVVRVVRDWLVQEAGSPTVSPTVLWQRFNEFTAWNYDELKSRGYSKSHIRLLPDHELSARMARWLKNNPN